MRASWSAENPDMLRRLIRALGHAAAFAENPVNRDEAAAILAAPNRIGASAEVIRRTLDGRLKVTPDGTMRISDRYLLVGRKAAGRPEPAQAAWLYAQMVRWGQAPYSGEMLAMAKAVFRADLYDAALPGEAADMAGEPVDGIGAFTGPPFDLNDIERHIAASKIRR